MDWTALFRFYSDPMGFYFGNEYVLQLFLTGLFILPWKRRRRLFPLRFLLSSLVYFAVGIFIAIPLPWHYLILFLIYLGVVFLSFETTPIECVFFGGNAYCVQFVISNLSYAVTYAVSYLYASFALYFVLAYIFLVGIGLLVHFGYFRKFDGESELKVNSVFVLAAQVGFLLVSVFFTYSITLAVDPSNIFIHMLIKFFGAVFGLSILLINVLNNRNSELTQEKQILQLLLRKDKEEYERAKFNEEQLNIKYHDIKKAIRLGVMTEEVAREAESSHLYYTGNRALDIVLAAESRVCAQRGIRFICTADGGLLNALGIKSYHVYSLLANILDNAIESLEEADPDKREIRLSIQRRGSMCIIHESNYVENAPSFRDALPQTTKSDKENHGYGSKSIRHIAQLYGGSVRFGAEGQIFQALVMLPVPEVAKADPA